MKKVNIGLVIFCFVLLAAHFFRYGWLELASISLAVPLLLFIRKPWVPVIIQIALFIASVEWIRTLINTIQYRIDYDMPWIRMTIIISAIVAVNISAAILQRPSTLLKRKKRVNK